MELIDEAELAQLRRDAADTYAHIYAKGEAAVAGIDGPALARRLAALGILRVLIFSSGRLREVAEAWAEDLRPGGLIVSGSAGSHVVVVEDEGQEVLRRHARLVGGAGPLFPAPDAAGAARRELRRLAARARLSRSVGTHTLRQTFGRRVLQARS